EKASVGATCRNRRCARISKSGGSSGSIWPSTRIASSDYTRSTARILRRVRRAHGLSRGSRRRRQGRSKPTIAVPCFAHRLVGEKNQQAREELDTPAPGGRLATFMSVAQQTIAETPRR